MTLHRFEVTKSCRADVFVSEQTGLTRSHAKKLFEEGHVRADGVSLKAGAALKTGVFITVEIPDPKPIEAQAENIDLRIIYEDDDFAVIDKPQGMVVHAGAGHESGTLVNACLFRLKSLSGIGGVLRPGIVHRLDKDTSGLILIAKNDAAHLSLSEQIRVKTCSREYLALLEGAVKTDSGTINRPLARDKNDRLKYAVAEYGEGRDAVTDYFVEERFRDNTFVRFKLHTGRTHQIRVHAKSIGHPVVGDLLYGYKKQRFSLEGQLLHAFRLGLNHPRTGERLTFTAPLPSYFTRVLEILRKENKS